jgi:hypothetical protein
MQLIDVKEPAKSTRLKPDELWDPEERQKRLDGAKALLKKSIKLHHVYIFPSRKSSELRGPPTPASGQSFTLLLSDSRLANIPVRSPSLRGIELEYRSKQL